MRCSCMLISCCRAQVYIQETIMSLFSDVISCPMFFEHLIPGAKVHKNLHITKTRRLKI